MSSVVLPLIYITINLCVFVFGISEAVFITKYNKLDHECGSIREWILAASIMNICVPIMTGCGMLIYNDGDGRCNKNTLFMLLKTGQSIVAIWSVITYFTINPTCRDFWTNNAPELWTFVIIHFIMFWVGVAIILLIFSGLLIYSCVQKINSGNNTQVGNSL